MRNIITGQLLTGPDENEEHDNLTGRRIEKHAHASWPSLSGEVPVVKAEPPLLWPSLSPEDDAVEKGDAFEHFVPLLKTAEERICCGIVYVPDEEDSQGDFASAREIRKAAYRFMESHQVFRVNHDRLAKTRILESYLAPANFTIQKQVVKKGSWVLTVRVLDEKIWAAIKKGTITGFSMAGTARRDAA